MLRQQCLVCTVYVCLSVCNVGVMWTNGWMDQDPTWYGGRPRARRHCVRWGVGNPAPPHRKGHSSPSPTFQPMSIVAKRSLTSATAELLYTISMPAVFPPWLGTSMFVIVTSLSLQGCDNADIFFNRLIQFYSNNATHLPHLSSHSTSYRVAPQHRNCNATIISHTNKYCVLVGVVRLYRTCWSQPKTRASIIQIIRDRLKNKLRWPLVYFNIEPQLNVLWTCD